MCLNVVSESHEIGHHFQKRLIRPIILPSHIAYSPYSRILHYWIDSQEAPANGGSGM